MEGNNFSHSKGMHSFRAIFWDATLVLQDPSESVFWAGFKGLNTQKVIWSTRARLFMSETGCICLKNQP